MKKLNAQGGRNFGYGKQMHFAAKQALHDRYGEQNRFATQAAHVARFRQFADYCKSEGIRDARAVDALVIRKYADQVSEKIDSGMMRVSYGQNLLSSVNVVMSAMRGNHALNVSPAALIGNRTHCRQACPLSYDREKYESVLNSIAQPEVKLAVVLAREFGLRLRETALFRPAEALKQWQATGAINIRRGVKGGRTLPRIMTLNKTQVEQLKTAVKTLGSHKALVDAAGKYTTWRQQFYKEYERSGIRAALGKFHDHRAAFACEKFRELTGKDARVVDPLTDVSKKAEYMAKLQIASMLGHGRVDVMRSYTA